MKEQAPSRLRVLENRDLLELLLSHLSEFVIVLTDTDGRFISWHPGVARHFCYAADEFIGQTIELLFPLADRLEGIPRKELQNTIETGRANDTRYLIRKDGQQILVDGVTVALRDQEQRLAGFGKVLRDVTEQKNVETSLRALAGALDQSTVIVRRWDGTIEHWTAGCERLYGWSAEEAVGQVAHTLLKTKFPEPLDEIQQQLLQLGSWKGELEHVKRDGSRLLVSIHWVLLTDSDKEAPDVIETISDITARFQMQLELEAANERLKRMAFELERSNEELEEFARIASHDLSAPITSTRWLVGLLVARHAQKLDASGQEYLAQIGQALERMSALIDAVLTHAQVGKSAIGSSTAVDADQALAIAVENLRKDIETSNAQIIRDPLPKLFIDSPALTQLFQNLLSNAIKYRKKNTPPIIKVSAVQQGATWVIGVQDNGIGIDPAWFDRIFQPMQRLHGLEISGSGIGLATCKKIVTRAGGRIWVESELGSGSTFLFTIPGSATT